MIVIEDNNIKRNLFFKIIDKIKRILNYFFLDFIIKLSGFSQLSDDDWNPKVIKLLSLE